MKDHAILMSDAMIRAYMTGLKTQTRRLPNTRNARYRVGDRLWFQETHMLECGVDGILPEIKPGRPYREFQNIETLGEDRVVPHYRATDPKPELCGLRRNSDSEGMMTWVSGRFMPRWAARFKPMITGIREERLQDILEEDAIAEGCSGTIEFEDVVPWPQTPREAYADFWDSLNGKKPGCAWKDNPLVKVIEFEGFGE